MRLRALILFNSEYKIITKTKSKTDSDQSWFKKRFNKKI